MKKFLVYILVGVLIVGCGKQSVNEADVRVEEDIVEDTGETSSKEENTDDAIVMYDDFSYKYLYENDLNSFEFASGVGAWCTYITINSDGSFEGVYRDDDMGACGEGYPHGTRYFSSFSGHLGELEKIDDLTYKTKLLDISYDDEFGEEIKDEILWIYTDAYGISEAEDIYFYLPGTDVSALSDEAISWLDDRLELGSWDKERYSKLHSCAMYVENGEYTWNN